MKILAVNPEDLPAILALQKQAFESEARLVGSYEIPPMTQTLADLEQLRQWMGRMIRSKSSAAGSEG